MMAALDFAQNKEVNAIAIHTYVLRIDRKKGEQGELVEEWDPDVRKTWGNVWRWAPSPSLVLIDTRISPWIGGPDSERTSRSPRAQGVEPQREVVVALVGGFPNIRPTPVRFWSLIPMRDVSTLGC